MEHKKGCFWLYQDDERVAGLYGIFCQFVSEPKVYTLSDEQIERVLGNFKNKLDRMYASTTSKSESINDICKALDDKETIDFNQLRIYTLDGEHIRTYKIQKPTLTQLTLAP